MCPAFEEIMFVCLCAVPACLDACVMGGEQVMAGSF